MGKSYFHQRAEAAIGERLHEKLFDALNTNDDDGDVAGDVLRAEIAVFKVLNDPSIAWALAYTAGVVMAPELAQAQPAQPSGDGVG